MAVNFLNQLFYSSISYVLALWQTLFVEPSPDTTYDGIDLDAVEWEVQWLLPHHLVLHIPLPTPDDH